MGARKPPKKPEKKSFLSGLLAGFGGSKGKNDKGPFTYVVVLDRQ